MRSGRKIVRAGFFAGMEEGVGIMISKYFLGIALLAVFCLPVRMTGQWVSTNGPYGGTACAFASNGRDIFAGSPVGLYHSVDAGASWTRTPLPFTNVTAAGYFGTRLIIGTGSGVWLSDDNGLSFSPGGSAPVLNAFAAAAGIVYGASDNSVYASSSSGSSWTNIGNRLHATAVRSIATAGPNIVAATDSGIYLSSDAGGHWMPAVTSPADTNFFSISGGTGRLFAGGDSGVYISSDNGANWKGVPDRSELSGVKVLAVAGSRVFAGYGNNGIYISSNNGASWVRSNSGLTDSSVVAIAVSGKIVFAGTTYQGIFESTNNGAQWSPASIGFSAMDIESIVSEAGAGNGITPAIICATSSGTPFISSNDGGLWDADTSGLSGDFVTSLFSFASRLFAGTGDGGVYEATPGWRQWTTTTLGSGTVNGFGLNPHAGGGYDLFVGVMTSIYSSPDTGRSWRASGYHLTSVNCFQPFDGKLFAGTARGVVYSTDGGFSWIESGLDYTSVNSMAAIGGQLFAATSRYGVFVSTDDGLTWRQVNSGLSDHDISSLTLMGIDLFAMTGDGVYRTTNAGGSWLPMTDGMTGIPVRSLAVSGSMVFVSTSGAGVWMRPLADIVTLMQLSAVPDNGRITLHWTPDYHSGLAGYRILSGPAPNPATAIDSTGPSDTTATFDSLRNGNPYYFRVVAVDTGGTEINSTNEVSAIPGLFLTAVPENGEVFLHWSKDYHPGFLHYRIFADTVPNPSAVADSTPGDVTDTSITIFPLNDGTVYYFRVTAVASDWSESNSSNIAQAKPGLVNFQVDNGWNVLSVPFLMPDNHLSELFPPAVSSAYSYSGNYTANDTLTLGKGYWIRFSGRPYVTLNGGQVDADSVPVTEGWNLIGSISTPLDAAQIASVPGGLVTSQFFGYTNGYSTANVIMPGKGYWVKLDQAGTLLLAPPARQPSAAGRIRIVPRSELPPPAPGSAQGDVRRPTDWVLGQNYPNPFNPVTIIPYGLPSAAHVTLTVYNILGQATAVLVDRYESAGYKSAEFDASNLPSGVYTYVLKAGSFSRARRLVIVK